MAKVFINPGHDRQYDSGAVSPRTGLRECDVAKKVGDRVEHYLNAVGIETNSVQSDNLNGERPPLPSVCGSANIYDADLFVSIHCNAFNTQAKGTETLCYSTGGKGYKLAKCIQKQIVDSLPVVDRGVKARPDLCVLRNTDMPAVLVELAFIDNADDEGLLVEREDDFARAIARGVTDYFLEMASK